MIIGIDANPIFDKKITGIGNYLLNVLNEFSDDRNKYILYTYSKNDKSFDFKFNYEIKKIDASTSMQCIYFKLPKILYRDMVDIFWGANYMMPKRNKYTKNIKFIATIHDLAFLVNRKWFNLKDRIRNTIFCKKITKYSDYFFTISNSTKNDMLKFYPFLESNKILNASCAYSIDDNIMVDSELKPMVFNFKYFLYLGSLDKRKNIINIIKGYEQFKLEHKSNIKLVLAGKFANAYKESYNYVIKKNLNNDVIFKEYVTNVEKQVLMQNCELFLFPSCYEGFGIPILEAYYYNKIVLVANNSSLVEIAGEHTPIINDCNDFYAIADELYKFILMDEASKNNIIKKNKEQLALFSWKKTADLIQKEINKIGND